MKVSVFKTSEELGKEAAEFSAVIINKAIAEKGTARIVLSTGASQFDTLRALIKQDIDWTKVEMFHLDEYVDLSESHPASFRKYLKERFTNLVKLKNSYFVNGTGNIEANIEELTRQIRKAPIDIGLIGIGENAHIAFNDPPADFNTKAAYIVVDLDDNCKKQQVGEGWFTTIAEVPKQAISMSVYQILQCKVIVSAVPGEVKANAMKLTLENEVSASIPATKLKEHSDVHVFLDQGSAAMLNSELLNQYK